jgi:hypothetical protein
LFDYRIPLNLFPVWLQAKEMGFMIGRRQITDSAEAERAAENMLTATKIIPSRFQSEFHNF